MFPTKQDSSSPFSKISSPGFCCQLTTITMEKTMNTTAKSLLNTYFSQFWTLHNSLLSNCLTNQFINCVKQSNSLQTLFSMFLTDLWWFLTLTILSLTNRFCPKSDFYILLSLELIFFLLSQLSLQHPFPSTLHHWHHSTDIIQVMHEEIFLQLWLLNSNLHP